MCEPIRVLGIEGLPSIDPYHRTTGRLTAPVFKLDPRDRTCWLTQHQDSGMTPMSEWHGLVLAWSVERAADWGDRCGAHDPDEGVGYDEAVVRAYLESPSVQALLAAVCDGHTVEWDGNNHVGDLSEAANRAFGQVLDGLAALPPQYESVWTEGWLDDWQPSDDERARLLAADDRDLAAFADETRAIAEIERVLLLEDVEAELARWRERLREELDDAA